MADNKKKKIPSGLVIKRKNNKFTCTWKVGKDYKHNVEFSRRAGTGKSHKWTNPVALGTTTKSRAFEVNENSWFPHMANGKYKDKLTKVSFKVKGDDGWSDAKEYKILKPNVPKVTVTVQQVPSVKFDWKVKTSNTSHKWFDYIEYQSILSTKARYDSKDNKANVNWNKAVKGSKKWDEISNSAEGSLTVTEDSGLINDGNSYTRWFRARAVGPAGKSEWSKPKKHTYALPNTAVVDVQSIEVTENTSASGYTCRVKFEAGKSSTRPIDTYEVQYALAVPDAGMVCPDKASWQPGYTAKAYDKSGGAEFSIDSLLAYDQCLFIRVNTIYDGRTTYGTPVLPEKGVGKLIAPTINSITTDSTTYSATITATNNSDVDDSNLIVRYITAKNPDGDIVGTIPHGLTSVIVKCPEWDDETKIAFSVQAIVQKEVDNNSTHMRLTDDTSVITGKMYFEQIGEDTEDDPYEYIQIDEFEAGDNPAENGWYESDSTLNVAVNVSMQSAIVRQGGSVPVAPKNVKVDRYKISGTIRVTWDWAWDDADSAEISWADHEDAWESTEEPEVYEITKMRASAWNISGLETGKTWYVRVRLISGIGDDRVYGAYSALSQGIIDLSSAPAIPALNLSDDTVTEDGSVIASWTFVSTDDTGQLNAEIYEVVYEGDVPNYTKLNSDNIGSSQRYTIKISDMDWHFGETHYIAVKVWSESMRESPLSNVEQIMIAEPPACEILDKSLENINITIPNEDGTTTTESVLSLIDMPFDVVVAGSGDGAIAQVAVKRAEAYYAERPDETDFNGYKGETILSDYEDIKAVYTETEDTTAYVDKQYYEYDDEDGSYTEVTPESGDNPHALGWYTRQDIAEFSFNNDSLIGRFDDGALYTLTATVQDSHGKSEPQELNFEVHWSDQALMPQAEARPDYEYMVSILRPIAPSGARETDVCDIYRLSVDKPQLIYEGATFGTEYVDPYPAIGQFGGHRFVFRTANNDYITEDNEYAWTDTNDIIKSDYNIIEFGTGRVMLDRNVDLSISWSKDFQQTNYLGGSVRGDWGKAVERSGSVNAVAITLVDQDTIAAMRRLAEWTSICHVRTVDGSSYAADVQVSESYNHSTGKVIATFSLKVTRVDTQVQDGITYVEWERTHPHG